MVGVTVVHGIIRVVLVDDHPAVLVGIQRVLEHASDVAVVGKASTGEQAIDVVRRTSPDVVVLDIGLPDVDGISLIADLRRMNSTMKVVMLTCQTDRASVRMAIDAGASGYLTKTASPHRIVEAVRDAMHDQVAISPDVVRHLVSAIRDQHGSGEPTLTSREREVWRNLALGLSNGEIARTLYLSEHTVKFHVHNLLRKLGVKTRAEAICAAHRRGMPVD